MPEVLTQARADHGLRIAATPSPAVADVQIAYIMKGYPRRSEPFISNEIHLLERLGVGIQIFAIKGFSEDRNYPPVDQIRAPVTYLSEDPSSENGVFPIWLWKNLPRLYASHWGLLIRRPMSYVRTLVYALFLAVTCEPRWMWGIPIPDIKTTILKDFLRAGAIARSLQASAVRHLHGHFCHGSTTMTLFVSMFCRLPFSFTAHAKDIYLPRLNPGRLLQTKIRRAKFVVTCTQANHDHLSQLGVPVTPIHTVYHGLNPTFFAPPATSRGDRRPPLILSIGRFVEKKGFPILIQACQRLRDNGHDFRCRIIGSADQDSQRVADLIRRYQLESVVEICAAVSQTELRAAYHAADIFALPCRIASDGDRDGIPNVLAEAMSTELPVVSTTVSGIPEMVENDVAGLLVPPDDPAALAAALEKLILSPEWRARLGRRARQNVCRVFDAEQTSIVLRDLFIQHTS